MVLAMAVARKLIDEFFEREERLKREKEREYFWIALGVEAERRRRETGVTVEEAVAQLMAEDWRPAQSE